MSAAKFNDDAIGRVLDIIYEYGTWKLFSEISLHTFKEFNVDCSTVHQDTTSVSVWGEYEPKTGDTFTINYVYSKNNNPDLKQFVINLLCVEANLPLHAGVLNGNTSDKNINGNILAQLPQIMAGHGVAKREFIYFADSALITTNNLTIINDDILFISRLPANFGSCNELIGKAVLAVDSWLDVGQLSEKIVKGKNVCASYRIQEETVVINDMNYRALIVHSDAHDRRRQKSIEKALAKDKSIFSKKAEELSQKKYFCLPDAQAAVEAFQSSKFHEASITIEEHPIFGRGRPNNNESRTAKSIRYELKITVSEKREAIVKLKEKAGCFVLLSNVSVEKKSTVEILKTYKEQDGIEKNFGFLKDSLIVNDVFLKKPSRIEALGLVLVLSLLNFTPSLFRVGNGGGRRLCTGREPSAPEWSARRGDPHCVKPAFGHDALCIAVKVASSAT
jgi:transposase